LLYFTHLPRSPQWMDLYQIWYRGSPRGRNQLCRIFFRLVQGYWFCRGLKFAYSHRNWRSPLTLPELPFRLWSWAASTMNYFFLAAHLSFTFMYTCIFFSWQINSAAAVVQTGDKSATKSTVADTVDFVAGFGDNRQQLEFDSLSRSTLSPTRSTLSQIQSTLSSECRTSVRLCRQCVRGQSDTVDFIDIQQSRPCWIQLCRQYVPGFTRTWWWCWLQRQRTQATRTCSKMRDVWRQCCQPIQSGVAVLTSQDTLPCSLREST